MAKGDILNKLKIAGYVTSTDPSGRIEDALDIREGGDVPTGTIEITENGDHDVTNYATAHVDVPTGGGSGLGIAIDSINWSYKEGFDPETATEEELQDLSNYVFSDVVKFSYNGEEKTLDLIAFEKEFASKYPTPAGLTKIVDEQGGGQTLYELPQEYEWLNGLVNLHGVGGSVGKGSDGLLIECDGDYMGDFLTSMESHTQFPLITTDIKGIQEAYNNFIMSSHTVKQGDFIIVFPGFTIYNDGKPSQFVIEPISPVTVLVLYYNINAVETNPRMAISYFNI